MNQITIVTKDYNGLTADIPSALGSNNINIESLDTKTIPVGTPLQKKR